eukprot:TRINITY_DN22292_c0_g1_i2.p1 TRINITY_DN22292_c0_g1~~TRINITY_DN22292_c0_g1_i2.p1  ORF type:complete len:730 (+),score=196.09 TRINITY_DN22292_c0_g1_i2:271-2190(+)
MAAAQATNLTTQMKAMQAARAQATAEAQAQAQAFEAMQQAQAATPATRPVQEMKQKQPPSGPVAAMPPNITTWQVPQAMMQHPAMLGTAGQVAQRAAPSITIAPAGLQVRPPPVVVVQPPPPVPPTLAPVPPQPVAAEEVDRRARLTADDSSSGARGEVAQQDQKPQQEDTDAIRCHLHRKPQLSCKICRRVYYSALDPSSQKKGDSRSTKDKGLEKMGRDEDMPGVRERGAEAFEVANKQTFNFNSMLRDQILKNTYFKTLMNVDTFESIMDEMYQFVETAEAYGDSTATVPSSLFCCLFRLFTIGISYDELQQLLDSKDWPYIRCCGFLYIRFGCAAEKLWDHLGDYCLDDQVFEPSKSSPGYQETMGEYVEALLMDERYYSTTLPRIPAGVKKKLEQKVAPLGQYRKRTAQNRRCLEKFREVGTPVEACKDNGDWVEGQVVQVIETIQSRLMMRIRLTDGQEEVFHLGKVILREESGARRPSGRGRSRSRSRSPRLGAAAAGGDGDLSRNRGKSLNEMLQELRDKQRERAVCSTGKDYARKPIGFMSGLALKRDMGIASARLREEETYAPRQVEHLKQMTEAELMDRAKKEGELDREKQARMQQLFEKYGNVQSQKNKEQSQGQFLEENAEVLRFG